MAYVFDVDSPETQGRYGPQISIMRHMRWSWQDLLAAPSDLVEEIYARIILTAKAKTERQKLDKSSRD